MLLNYLYVALGGALGSMLRYGATTWLTPQTPPGLPWATLSVNILGAFLIGFLAVYLPPHPGNSALRLLLMVGLLGGFTTFSAFSLETLHLLQDGAWARAALNSIASVGLCLLAAFAGAYSSRSLIDFFR